VPSRALAREFGLVPPVNGAGCCGFALGCVAAFIAVTTWLSSSAPDGGHRGRHRDFWRRADGGPVSHRGNPVPRSDLRRLPQGDDWINALISSAIYAILHFMESASQVAGPLVFGPGAVAPDVRGFADLDRGARLLQPDLAGSLLGLPTNGRARLSSFHADLRPRGGALTDTTDGTGRWFWGTDRMTDGWLALPVLALACDPGPQWPASGLAQPEPRAVR
jgi:hypothetical protein